MKITELSRNEAIIVNGGADEIDNRLMTGAITNINSALIAEANEGEDIFIGVGSRFGFGLAVGAAAGLFFGAIITQDNELKKASIPYRIVSAIKGSLIGGLVGGVMMGTLTMLENCMGDNPR